MFGKGRIADTTAQMLFEVQLSSAVGTLSQHSMSLVDIPEVLDCSHSVCCMEHYFSLVRFDNVILVSRSRLWGNSRTQGQKGRKSKNP